MLCTAFTIGLQSMRVLKLVLVQVNGYAGAHGIQYGMITNVLWNWVFVMDGCNNMKVSGAFRYDARQPTVLQVCAHAMHSLSTSGAATCVHSSVSTHCSLSMVIKLQCSAAPY